MRQVLVKHQLLSIMPLTTLTQSKKYNQNTLLVYKKKPRIL
nr:MAG TPA: hypothetical protein [Caudoviricetes sp.]